MKWYIGQEIVAIKDHSQKYFKKGDVFIIKGLKSVQCKCNYILINVGITSSSTKTCCIHCGAIYEKESSACWFNESQFAPLDFDISELTSILETPLELAHEQRKEKGQ